MLQSSDGRSWIVRLLRKWQVRLISRKNGLHGNGLGWKGGPGICSTVAADKSRTCRAKRCDFGCARSSMLCFAPLQTRRSQRQTWHWCPLAWASFRQHGDPIGGCFSRLLCWLILNGRELASLIVWQRSVFKRITKQRVFDMFACWLDEQGLARPRCHVNSQAVKAARVAGVSG